MESTYPFSACTELQYRCPHWVKCLLKEKYNLEQVERVIRHFNDLKVHKSKLDDMIISDISLEAYNDYQIYTLSKTWPSKIKLKVTSDQGDLFEFDICKESPLSDLKSILLNKKNKPFVLKFTNYNTQTVGQLLDKDTRKVNEIRVFYNLEKYEFDIEIFGQNHNMILLAEKTTKVSELMSKIENECQRKDCNIKNWKLYRNNSVIFYENDKTLDEQYIDRVTQLGAANLVIYVEFQSGARKSLFIEEREINAFDFYSKNKKDLESETQEGHKIVMHKSNLELNMHDMFPRITAGSVIRIS